MKKERRDEQVSSKVSHSTKLELRRISKECNISSGDILTNYVENKSNINAHEILLKINMLENHLESIVRLENEQNKILASLKNEHESVLKEIEKLKQLKPDRAKVNEDMEENIKNSVKAYFDIRNQHTNTYGIIDLDFDTLKVGKTLCGRYDVTYDTFQKSVNLIDNGLDLHEFLTNDISKYNIIK